MKQNTKIQFLQFALLIFSTVTFGQAKKWTLEECVNHAVVNNISIKQTTLDKQLADISKKDAIGRFLPSVNANARHSWNIGLNQDFTTGLLQNQTSQFSTMGLTVGVDLYKGLQNQNQLRRANLSIISSQYQLTKMQEDVSLNVVNAYLQILFNKENLKVQKEQLAFDTKQLDRTNEMVEAGSVPKGDLLDVKATVATDNQRLIAAENALLISRLSLAQLLQIDNFQEFDIVDTDVSLLESAILLQDPKAILEKAKETRTDLKIAQTNVQIAEKDVKIANGGYQPTLQAFYSFDSRLSYAAVPSGSVSDGAHIDYLNPTVSVGYVEGTNEQVLRDNFVSGMRKPKSLPDQFHDNKGHSFGLSLNIPILNGFAARNNVFRSKIALERSKIALEQQELDLERTVFTAYTDTKGALKTHEAAVATFEARQKSLEYAKERYEVGLMNIFDFSQAQTLYVNAQSEVLRTKYDYIFRTKILEFYFGIPIIQK